ncbi:MAG: hypothetical protein WC285_05740 [Candidatus Gracilibacteria bacterium]|jgi:hypothetical protein
MATNQDPKKTNLAPSALFVKEHVLDIIYPKLRDEGLVIEANEIIIGGNKGNDTQTIEFRIKCRTLAQKEIESFETQGGDPEVMKKKKNAWNNFSAALIANVKPVSK